jgi:hypothetical protein
MRGFFDDTLTDNNKNLVEDLLFLEAWESGRVPWSRAASVVFRVRQLRRAIPALKDVKGRFDNDGLDSERSQSPKTHKAHPEKIGDMMLQSSNLDGPAIPPDGTRYFVRYNNKIIPLYFLYRADAEKAAQELFSDGPVEIYCKRPPRPSPVIDATADAHIG